MIPRGLAAVLATFPLSMGLPNAEAYPQIIFFIVITSVIITTIGLGGAKKIPPQKVRVVVSLKIKNKNYTESFSPL